MRNGGYSSMTLNKHPALIAGGGTSGGTYPRNSTHTQCLHGSCTVPDYVHLPLGAARNAASTSLRLSIKQPCNRNYPWEACHRHHTLCTNIRQCSAPFRKYIPPSMLHAYVPSMLYVTVYMLHSMTLLVCTYTCTWAVSG